MNKAEEDALRMMGEIKTVVAAVTGIKQQFVDAGWTAEGAEQMTLHLMKQSTKAAP